jgi:hypothetical protein
VIAFGCAQPSRAAVEYAPNAPLLRISDHAASSRHRHQPSQRDQPPQRWPSPNERAEKHLVPVEPTGTAGKARRTTQKWGMAMRRADDSIGWKRCKFPARRAAAEGRSEGNQALHLTGTRCGA